MSFDGEEDALRPLPTFWGTNEKSFHPEEDESRDFSREFSEVMVMFALARGLAANSRRLIFI